MTFKVLTRERKYSHQGEERAMLDISDREFTKNTRGHKGQADRENAARERTRKGKRPEDYRLPLKPSSSSNERKLKTQGRTNGPENLSEKQIWHALKREGLPGHANDATYSGWGRTNRQKRGELIGPLKKDVPVGTNP